MDKVAKLPAHQRKELFQQTAAKMPWFSEAAIEKDFWVCWMLKQLFNSSIQNIIIFIIGKGHNSMVNCPIIKSNKNWITVVNGFSKI